MHIVLSEGSMLQDAIETKSLDWTRDRRGTKFTFAVR